MGIDPGFRTGCKIAIVDSEGKYIEGAAIYPHEPRRNWEISKQIIKSLIEKHNVGVIAIGDGTASRETETLIAEIIPDLKKPVSYTMVSEAGASVYSVSEVAKEEFPELDASMRGNISIARRLLDPLSELVKIDPKSIGIGLYQHDVNQKKLDEALDAVVESCVNYVGVDLNTASVELLKYIAGISSRVAKNIKKYRDENGKFKTRNDLKNVSGIGEKIFEQSAGFLKIPDGDNSLDNTFIHPESYPACSKLLQRFGVKDPATIPEKIPVIKLKMKTEGFSLDKLSSEIGIGIPTLRDILDNLERPGRDPREELPGPVFRRDVLRIEDLKPNMVLKGTVRNVVDFGAFIDIGVKEDGLLHISEIKRKSGKENKKKNPLKMLAVGDVINVKVVKVDPKRGRIALSMKM
jgi:uncharacterized protein